MFVLYLCICFLCTVVCMYTTDRAHIFIVCNSVICTKSFNILSLLSNGHIALKYTGYFVYFIYIEYWTCILLLTTTGQGTQNSIKCITIANI